MKDVSGRMRPESAETPAQDIGLRSPSDIILSSDKQYRVNNATFQNGQSNQ